MITQPAVLDSLSTPAPTRGANSGRLSIFAVLLFLLVFVAVYVMLHLVSFTQSFPHWATAVLEGSEGKTLLAALLTALFATFTLFLSHLFSLSRTFARLHMENQLLLHTIGEGLFVTDATGLITFINDAACTILHRPRHEVLGQPGHRFLRIQLENKAEEGESPHLLCPIREAVQYGVQRKQAVGTLLLHNDTCCEVEFSSAPIRQSDGTPTGAVVSIRDITRRREAERRLQASEEQLRTLVHYCPDTILNIDKDATILFSNRISANPSNNTFHFLEGMPEIHKQRYQKTLEKVFHEGQSAQLQYALSDAEWWSARFVPIVKDEKVVSAMVINTDITERRVTQAQAVRYSRLATIGVLAASVAHEVNNPNNAIRFNATFLAR
ncbi:MAG: PAS domain-containing protein, partial [Magnetococcales bacterium]|nr:PAS domain-containing protein [Magnetococcales bacterium]